MKKITIIAYTILASFLASRMHWPQGADIEWTKRIGHGIRQQECTDADRSGIRLSARPTKSKRCVAGTRKCNRRNGFFQHVEPIGTMPVTAPYLLTSTIVKTPISKTHGTVSWSVLPNVIRHYNTCQNSIKRKKVAGYMNEALFIRALCMYHLMDCFGSFPMREYTETDYSVKPQILTRQQAIDRIEKELTAHYSFAQRQRISSLRSRHQGCRTNVTGQAVS